MKKKMLFGIIFCVSLCILTSCSRKVIGATPHRRDRNCGCENICTNKPACDLAVNYDATRKNEEIR